MLGKPNEQKQTMTEVLVADNLTYDFSQIN
jgi:hypothetical protein